MDLDDTQQWPLSRLLITASRLVEHDIASNLRPLHLTHASFGVLALVDREPLSQRALAQATRVEQQTISQLVDRLERDGMVTRERDPNDRRRYLVTVTASGRRAVRRATTLDQADKILDGLPQSHQLRASLVALIERLGGRDDVPAFDPGTAPHPTT